MRLWLTALVLALLGAPASASDDLVEKGKGVYKMFCSHCHGIDMVNSGASSFDLRKFPVDEKDRFVTSVTKGKGDMPAWGDVLLPDELEQIWAYVATRGGKEPMPVDEQAMAPAPAVPPTVENGVLTACMARNNGVMSARRHDGGAGLDYRVAEAVADRLRVSLSVVWTEGEAEEESDPVRETYALLSAELCDVVASHPLYSGAVGLPPADRARVPRWLGMPRELDPQTNLMRDRPRDFVDLRPVTVTAPYLRATIGLVYRDGMAEPRGLDDLGGRRLALQQGTLSGAIATQQAPHDVMARARMHSPGAGFLWEVELGDEDVAIVDAAAFDAHRHHNASTTLRLSEWRHPIGFDIGFALLEENAGLKTAMDGALSVLAQDGVLANLAEAEGVSYTPPAGTGLAQPLTLRMLTASN